MVRYSGRVIDGEDEEREKVLSIFIIFCLAMLLTSL